MAESVPNRQAGKGCNLSDFLKDILVEKRPPPGGLTRLRTRLDQGPSPRHRLPWLWSLGTLATVLLSWWWFSWRPSDTYEFDREQLAAAGLAPPVHRNIALGSGEMVFHKLTEQPEVVVYQVVRSTNRNNPAP